MNDTASHSLLPAQRCMVYPAGAFRVDVGAHMDEPLGDAEATCVGDVYRLSRSAQLVELTLGADGCSVGHDSSIGLPNVPVTTLARHSLMNERGTAVEVLILMIGPDAVVLPLGPLNPAQDYTLLASEAAAPSQQLSNVASVSFTRGTKVTMGNGLQVAVEDIRVGDKVLTRDHGPQPVRWIGMQTVRAEGNRAPVMITKGALNNADDLVLSPDHRLFIYQRRDAIGAGRAEVLVRARHLVNDETIYVQEGGFVDYFHILFDNHEIIYVEGIQAESLLVAPDTLAGFDDDLKLELDAHLQGRSHEPHHGAEPSARDLFGLDAAEILKRASQR